MLALDDLRHASADGVVSIGGGSTIGLGKAISVRTGLPHLAVPTTYAGSEMTPILGETENGSKTTRRAPEILPVSTIYDVDLTLGLPAEMSATSGMNAIAHAVEALYAPDGNPIITLLAEDAIRTLAGALPTIRERPADREARHRALYGAWLAGPVSARLACRCITRSATRSAAHSICRMPKPIPSCCLTFSPSWQKRCRRRLRRYNGRWVAARAHRAACRNWPGSSERRFRSRRSGCRARARSGRGAGGRQSLLVAGAARSGRSAEDHRRRL